MKKVLMLASVASMIGQFNIPNIEILQEMGYQVDVACNFKSGSTCADETIAEWKRKLQKMGVRCYQVDISRSVTDVVSNTKALWQVEYLLDKNQYEFIHCHSPIGSVVARIAGKIKHTKVIYTAHGFHFFKGAPKKNWMIYYPVEKFLSRWTDTIITINHEDYERAKSKFHAKRVEYIPGVGIDLDKFSFSLFTKEECGDVRKELGIPEDAIWLLSVGELNVNKNHETVIRALDGLREKEPETFANLYYTVAGEGDRRDELQSLIETLGLSAQVKLLGYRNDVSLLCESADIFVMPSFREGLPVSLMEAMASGLPCVASRIRGNTDLLDEKGGMLFDPHSVDECWKAIGQVIHSNIEEAGCHNRNKIKHFGKAVVEKAMAETYGNVEKDNGNSGGGVFTPRRNNKNHKKT